jgi:hypothetical protein
MKPPLFFPDSEYLADKWWHRLAIVIFWSWLLLATGVFLGIAGEIWDHSIDFDWNEISEILFLLLPLYVVSWFLPTVVYRAILFVCTGSAWKGTKSG